jgi:anti-sigma B factor antagonist
VRQTDEAESGFEILVERSDQDVAVVRIAGEIDLSTSDELDAELEHLTQTGGGRRIVLDLSGVEFLDSTGLRVLWAARQRAQTAGGGLAIESPSESVMRVLRVTRLDKVFQIMVPGTGDVRDG